MQAWHRCARVLVAAVVSLGATILIFVGLPKSKPVAPEPEASKPNSRESSDAALGTSAALARAHGLCAEAPRPVQFSTREALRIPRVLLLLGVSFLFLTGNSGPMMFGGAILIAVGNGLMWALIIALLSEKAGDRQGVVQGLAGSTGAVANIIGLITGGVLYSHLGALFFGISAGLAFLVTLIALANGTRTWLPLSTVGNLTSDAHLAALAIENGYAIYSTDHDFRRFPGIEHVNPLA